MFHLSKEDYTITSNVVNQFARIVCWGMVQLDIIVPVESDRDTIFQVDRTIADFAILGKPYHNQRTLGGLTNGLHVAQAEVSTIFPHRPDILLIVAHCFSLVLVISAFYSEIIELQADFFPYKLVRLVNAIWYDFCP